MKRILFSLAFCGILVAGSSQNKDQEHNPPTEIIQCSHFEITPQLRDLVPIPPEVHEKSWEVPNKFRRVKSTNAQALPQGNDPAWQKQGASHYNKAPLVSFNGHSVNSYPPDPSGAVGPSHYCQMTNSGYTIFDKSGTVVYGPASLSSLLGSGNGDPIVMYDKAADRWFFSQFNTSTNKFLIAISTTSDPLGSYYNYEFTANSFPDYPKYSVWGNAYLLTSNKSAPQIYAMDRAKMLAGDQTATMQAFTAPQLSTPGFFSILPSHASSTIANPNTPGYLYYYQDDSWTGVSQDHLKIWELTLDWANSGNSSISNPQTLNVSPFDSEFQANWDDIEQPGTSDRLDGVPGALMYMAQYREFSGYASVVFNHTVDVNGSDHAGIRWYELRKVGSNPWTLHQEGTFAPDGESRWMGSICMDAQGNIGLAYSVSGPTVKPSIRYTGRLASDPLGQMTLTEGVIIGGTGIQTGPNRWGDYAQMTIDPSDDLTFWYTGEYIGDANTRRTRIGSFKIASDQQHDVGVVSIDAPNNGILSSTETVTVTINNFGQNAESNFPVSFTVDGGAPVTEMYTGTIASGTSAQYTFTGTANLSTPNLYQMKAYTGLSGDGATINDTTMKTVEHTFPANVGVSVITAPNGSAFSTSETVTVTLENYGGASQTGFPVSYTVNGGTPVTETFNGTLVAGGNASFSFSTGANISNLGSYDFVAYTDLVGDGDQSNDTATYSIVHNICQPTGDCQWGDGFIEFQLGSINNSSGCTNGGYTDYTSMIAQINQGAADTVKVQSGYDDQVLTLWIDFNDNFTFEASERLITDSPFAQTLSSHVLNIPWNAPVGEHLLRARTNWANGGGATITDPCLDVAFGETEDYKVDIVASVGINETYNDLTYKVIDLGEGQFNLLVEGVDETIDIEIHNSIGQLMIHESGMNASSLNYKFNLSAEARGYYLVRISNKNFSKVQKFTYH